MQKIPEYVPAIAEEEHLVTLAGLSRTSTKKSTKKTSIKSFEVFLGSCLGVLLAFFLFFRFFSGVFGGKTSAHLTLLMVDHGFVLKAAGGAL